MIVGGAAVLVLGILAFALAPRTEAPVPAANSPLAAGNQPSQPEPVAAQSASTPGKAPLPGPPANIPPAKPAPMVSDKPFTPPKPRVNPSDLPPDHPAIPTEEGSQVGIQWLGYSCFYVHSPGGVAVVTDPFDPNATGLRSPDTGAHFVTVSSATPQHSFVQAVHGFKDEVTLKPLGLKVLHGEAAQQGDTQIQPIPMGDSTAYVIQSGPLRIAHLGTIRQPLSPAQVKSLGAIDILMIPVGEGLSPKQAVEITKAVKPMIVLPMAYSTSDMDGPAAKLRPVEDFIAASPYAVTRKDSDVIMMSKTDLPPGTEIYLLHHRP
jgi:L-ascorbate metabolism protein UlaG (beta-lactamase superfamily)